MHSGHSFFNGLTLSAPIFRQRHFLLGTLNPYYSRAGENQFCSTSHDLAKVAIWKAAQLQAFAP